ncbi:hypothetical protein LINPERHAP2_LOCUS9883 [Linum perenne]
MRAELRGIVEGMRLAWDRGIRKLCIQSDSKAAVSILSKVDDLDHRHIFREANNAADYLAKMGHDLTLGTHVFLYPDSSLLYWLNFDRFGSCLLRNFNNISGKGSASKLLSLEQFQTY